ncbi:MAG: ABC transporter ATP-binding protein [Clostridiales bacterium]|nr:ABC transporter ATP-binding protein [Clostridiales bacterium]
MAKLTNYLKPYTSAMLLSILFLSVQAVSDLNLPNYMSKIVNVGIQQGGIEQSAPEAVSAKGFSFMQIFMTDTQKKAMEDGYKLVSTKGPAAGKEEYMQKYPLLKTEDIYVRSNFDPQLDRIFGESVWTFINTVKTVAGQSGKAPSLSGNTDVTKMDMSGIYALRPVFAHLPAGTIENARAQALKNPEATLLQSGAAFSRSFYRELGVNTEATQTDYILRTGAVMLLIALAGGAATVLVGYFSAKISAGVARDLRRGIFQKVESFSNGEFDKFSTASLITRTTNDVMQVQMLLMMGLRIFCYAPILGIGGTFMALRKSASMSWIIALACVILVGMICVVYSVAMPKFRVMQQFVDRLNLIARENLNGLMVIRAFGTQEFESERFDIANRNLTNNSLFVNRVMAFLMPAMMLLMNMVTLLIVWIGAQQVADSAMQVGDMMAFIQYAMQIIMSFLMISVLFIMVPRAAVSVRRIEEVLRVELSIRDPLQAEDFHEDKIGTVEFRNVSFRYEGAGENALEGISFTALPGRTTAFIGSTGSGKTTLINLIPRVYDATSGEVLVNGVNVKNVRQRALRAQIGYVPQKGYLLSGTVASNLRCGDRNADEDRLKTAAEVAQAIGFINENPEGFDSEIAQAGSNVSGGQKQRLSIARALVKKPPIYIFDDSFSALDFKTDAALRRALKNYTGGSTVLIVAQRVGTIIDADQIIVLEDGKIVGRGTHEELLSTCRTYYEIASSQFSKEELA